MPNMIQFQSPAKNPNSAIAVNKCYLLSMDAVPKKGDALPDGIKAAYIRYTDQLYYSNPARNQLELVPKTTKEVLEKFDKEMNFSSIMIPSTSASSSSASASISGGRCKFLSKEDLEEITSITGYTPPSDPVRSIPICKFVQFNDSCDEVVWTNIKYDIGIKFSFDKIRDLLKEFLGLNDENAFNKLIFQTKNAHRTPIEYHASISKDPEVNPNKDLCNQVIDTIIKRKPENAIFKSGDRSYSLFEVGINIGSLTREYKLLLLNAKNKFESTAPKKNQICLFWDGNDNNPVEYSVIDLNEKIQKGKISWAAFTQKLEFSRLSDLDHALRAWTPEKITPFLDDILKITFERNHSLSTAPNYHYDAKHIEIKFALNEHTNTRVIVNVHFEDDSTKQNVKATVIELDCLIASIKEENIIKEIGIAEAVSLFNFGEKGYFIPKLSSESYYSVFPAYSLANKLLKEKDSRIMALETKVSTLETEVAALKSNVEKDTKNQNKLQFFGGSSSQKTSTPPLSPPPTVTNADPTNPTASPQAQPQPSTPQ